MKNKDKKEKLKIEQLYTEQSFIDYCLYDEYRTPKIKEVITGDFLKALEKDNLVNPLLKNNGKERQPDGTEKEVIIHYYSPFQVFLISALSKNKIDEDGLPRDFTHDITWQKQSNSRFISWGEQGAGINASVFKNPTYKRKKDFNIYDLSKDFHNLLEFIHSHEKVREMGKLKSERNRYYQNAPAFQYNFNPERETMKNELKKYLLSVEKIKRVKFNIASHAISIDPLEHWYYYLAQHPQWRKDKLKGAAILAQDLYGFCMVLDDIIEIASGEKSKLLPELVHQNIQPYGYTKTEYAEGTDLVMLKDVFSQFEEWLKSSKNKQIIEWVCNQDKDGQNWERVKIKMAGIKDELIDFERRYGEKRYLHGFMRVWQPEKILKVNDLDDKTKWYVQNIMRQRRDHGITKEKNGQSFITTSYDDVIELWRKGKKDEAIEKHFLNEEEYEITRAIESRLDDIAREIMDVCGWIREALWGPHYKIENEKKMAELQLWFKFNENHKRTDFDYAKKHVEFWEKGLKEGLQKWDNKLEKIEKAQKELYGFILKTRLVYCAVCRKKTVQLHHGHGDKIANSERVCDDCFEKVSSSTLNISEEEWKSLKYAEWKCDCGKPLYKFLLGNTASLLTKNSVAIKFNVEYGRVKLDAKCPECGIILTRFIDWGWLP